MKYLVMNAWEHFAEEIIEAVRKGRMGERKAERFIKEEYPEIPYYVYSHEELVREIFDRGAEDDYYIEPLNY